MMNYLEKLGVNVIGITEDFNGSEGGIWCGVEEGEAEHGKFKGWELFNYWADGGSYEFGVLAKLNELVQSKGWYFEWNDAGTIMAWEI